jgi:hypothetical protein
LQLSLTFIHFQHDQSVWARLGWVELLSGCRKQHQCCVHGWVSYIDIQKTGTSLPLPLTFLFFQWCSLQFVWVAGAAVMLTAAVVPS